MFGWLMNISKKRIQAALDQHEDETGERFELIKAGIPPLRLWLRNRKGDQWGKVLTEDGDETWVRLRRGIFKGSSLTFYD